MIGMTIKHFELELYSDCRQIDFFLKVINKICVSRHNQCICIGCFDNDIGLPTFLMKNGCRKNGGASYLPFQISEGCGGFTSFEVIIVCQVKSDAKDNLVTL